MPKIYTCTPVAFRANDFFFMRDTGLISTVLRQMGVESMCILPTPGYDCDHTDRIIRTEYKNLEDVEWWKGLGVDGVVLYAWCAPRYRRIAKAIHQAGIRLHEHADMDGVNKWWAGIKHPLTTLHNMAVDFFRARHLKYVDVITISPVAARNLRPYLFYNKRIRDKYLTFPCPVAPHFVYKGRKKEKVVIGVGMWSNPVKRGDYLMKTYIELLKLDPSVRIEIYGELTKGMMSVWENLPEEHKQRCQPKGFIENKDLPDVYNRVQVVTLVSEVESTHIASAEALCCGCSLAIRKRPQLSIPAWYTENRSGSVAEQDTPLSMAQAIHRELALWEQGERDPRYISDSWRPVFSIEKTMREIFNL